MTKGVKAITAETTVNKENNKFLLFIRIAILAGIIIAGLWPFDFFPKNKVFWIQDKNGLHFQNPGIAFTETPMPIMADSNNQSSFTMQFYLKPDEEPNTRLPAIITLWNPETSILIFIGQWKSYLIIRSYPEYFQGSRTYREIGLRGALPRDKAIILTITSTQEQTSIYQNGVLAKHYSNYSIIPHISSNHFGGAYLIVGNSIYGKAAWDGEIYELAFWNRQLTAEEISTNYQKWRNQSFFSSDPKGLVANYLFITPHGSSISRSTGKGPNLLIPEKFKPFKYSILSPIWRDISFSKNSVSDILLNILGFIPFGFFWAISRWKKDIGIRFRDYMRIIFAAGLLSLFIELAQVFLPTRHSQMLDVVCNTFGSLLGIYLFRLSLLHFPRSFKQFS